MRRMFAALLCPVACLLIAPPPAVAQSAREPNTCLACHSTLSDQRVATPAALFAAADVHRERGFACIDCHGGNPTANEKAKGTT
jgi:nitrate/TMAO reductase-like tetraheme cytochrome c subunit